MSTVGKYADKALDVLIKKPLKWLSEVKPMEYVCKKFRANKRNFISGLGIASIVIKDGLGCYFYVNQSLHNEMIPDDKRKFVAALDLANGGLMIAMQILMFKTVSNKIVQSKMFDKMFGKHFNRAARKGYQSVIKKQGKLSNLSQEEFQKGMDNIKETTFDAFANLTSLIAATTIGKRVIVPFIATPLADKTKAWMCRNDKPVEVNKETENTYSTQKPAAEVCKPGPQAPQPSQSSFGNIYPRKPGLKI